MNQLVDHLVLLKAALYGLVEGISEWLPISSTGHMLLLDQFVSLNVPKDFWDMFLVVIQLGAILAVCVMFFHQLNPFSRRKSSQERSATWGLWAKIVVACLPAAVIGIPLDNWMEEHLGNPLVIAAALVIYGIAFIVIETHRDHKAENAAFEIASAEVAGNNGASAPGPRHLAQPSGDATAPEGELSLADRDARVKSMSDLGWPTAIGIGLFQVLSMVPGTSRSGSTIIGGLLLGCSRSVAAEFTFYLAVPVMVGASGLRLVKYFLKGNGFALGEALILGVGCLVAFLVSLVVIRFLMGFVKRHNFKPFGWYRIVLGIAVAAYFLLVA